MKEFSKSVIGALSCIIVLLSLLFILCMFTSCDDYRTSKDLQYIPIESSSIDGTMAHIINNADPFYRQCEHYVVHHNDIGYINVSKTVYDAIIYGHKHNIKIALVFINNHGSRHLLLD